MSDARRYAVWPEPRSRSLKGSRPSVPHGTNFIRVEFLNLLSFRTCFQQSTAKMRWRTEFTRPAYSILPELLAGRRGGAWAVLAEKFWGRGLAPGRCRLKHRKMQLCNQGRVREKIFGGCSLK